MQPVTPVGFWWALLVDPGPQEARADFIYSGRLDVIRCFHKIGPFFSPPLTEEKLGVIYDKVNEAWRNDSRGI